MSKLFAFVGSTIGGAIGWWLGAPVGVMTAFIVGIVGSGVGLYFGRRAAIRFLE